MDSEDDAALLSGDGGLFREHDWNIVANRVDAPASLTFQTGVVRRQFHRCLALRADKNVEQLLRDSHWPPPRFLCGRCWHSTKALVGGQTRPCFVGGRPAAALYRIPHYRVTLPRISSDASNRTDGPSLPLRSSGENNV